MELTVTCGRAAVSLLTAVLLMDQAGLGKLELPIRLVKQGVAISESPVHGRTMEGGFLRSLAAHGLWRIGVRHSLGLVSARWRFMVMGDSEIASP